MYEMKGVKEMNDSRLDAQLFDTIARTAAVGMPHAVAVGVCWALGSFFWPASQRKPDNAL